MTSLCVDIQQLSWVALLLAVSLACGALLAFCGSWMCCPDSSPRFDIRIQLKRVNINSWPVGEKQLSPRMHCSVVSCVSVLCPQLPSKFFCLLLASHRWSLNKLGPTSHSVMSIGPCSLKPDFCFWLNLRWILRCILTCTSPEMYLRVAAMRKTKTLMSPLGGLTFLKLTLPLFSGLWLCFFLLHCNSWCKVSHIPCLSAPTPTQSTQLHSPSFMLREVTQQHLAAGQHGINALTSEGHWSSLLKYAADAEAWIGL